MITRLYSHLFTDKRDVCGGRLYIVVMGLYNDLTYVGKYYYSKVLNNILDDMGMETGGGVMEPLMESSPTTSKQQYHSQVRYHTQKSIQQYGLVKPTGHDIEHKICISYGFEFNIPAQDIAHIDNLHTMDSYTNRHLKRTYNIIDEGNKWILK